MQIFIFLYLVFYLIAPTAQTSFCEMGGYTNTINKLIRHFCVVTEVESRTDLKETSPFTQMKVHNNHWKLRICIQHKCTWKAILWLQ